MQHKSLTVNNLNNSLTGILINLFNLILLIIASFFANHSAHLSIILGFSISIYLITYYLLKKKNTTF